MAPDPLLDVLFRPTVAAPGAEIDVSAAPQREPGTRSRAGNAMARTRSALLDGARRAAELDGTRITMAQVAAAAGVAKATLYNHFRTREAVLAALLRREVELLVAETADGALVDALRGCAEAIAGHRVLRALAERDPATLVALARIDPSAPGWRMARDVVAARLAAEGLGGDDLVLRWFSSLMITPASAGTISDGAPLLVAALPPRQAARP
jgi:AcrR family transcriptional regulator